MKLICFPHAGGFSLYYAFLRKYAYRNLDKILVFDYPRSSLTLAGTSDDFQFYIRAAVDYIRANLEPDEEYILFGHSMGALIACEAGIAMQNTYGQAPAGVIVSGQNPPYALQFERRWEPPKDPVAFAKELGGVPQKILDHPEMYAKLYQYAETDLKAVSNYQPTETEGDSRLANGMLLYGDQDVIVEPDHRCYWDRTFRKMHSGMNFQATISFSTDHRSSSSR